MKLARAVLAFVLLAWITPLFAQSVPVGDWRFEEGSGTSAYDSSPSGNTGTLVNSPMWTSGKIGGALSFNGTNQSVAVSGAGSLANLYTTGVTVSAWVYVSGYTTLGRIVDKDNNAAGWFLALQSTGAVTFQSDQFPTAEPSRTSNMTIPLNTWTHIAATWDGGTSGANVHVYINGSLADGSSTDGSGTAQNDSTTPLTIGNRAVDSARGFKGTIDELRVYNKVLAASEIASIASDTQPPSAPSNLTGTSSSGTQIVLSWSASTDNVGVTSYLIERCTGTGCSNFTQIASVSTTSYTDSGLSASNTYSYRVRAIDAAGNLSAYSNTVSLAPSGGGGSAGLVGYWKFDEGAGTSTADSSGNGNTGTLTNGPTWTTGESGDALTFNGGSSYVAASGAGSLANLYSTGVTVAAWIKLSTSSGSGRIVDKDNNSVGWFLAMSGLNVKFQSDQFPSANPSRTSSGSVTTGTWTHVAVTWDGGVSGANIHLYINGVLSDGASVDGSGTAEADNTTPLTIGNRAVDAARGFPGSIDEVRIYSRVLSASEIASLASGSGGGSGDTQPPTAPSNLSAQAASGTQINLTWSASTDNVGVTSYLIERCQGSGCSSFAQIGTASGSSTAYSDTGLSGSTSYTYRVRASDAAGNLSGYSNTSSATTGTSDTQPPTAPGTPQVVASSSSELDLIWSASSDNVGIASYDIERCTGANCSNFAPIGSPTTAAYNDTGLAAATSYTYRVRASDPSGNLSPYSAVLTVTTPAASPDCN